MLLGCQTITFRNARPAWDLPATLDAVAAAGFEGAELASASVPLADPGALQALLAARGLRLAALHLNSRQFDPALRSPEGPEPAAVQACLERCGGAFLLVSGAGKAGPAALAGVLGMAGRRLRASGVTLCYHNHAAELAGGGAWVAEFCAASDPEDVGLALDIGWVLRAGGDPAEMVGRFAPRIRYVHIKDVRGQEWVELGRGDPRLPAALEALRPLDLPWWVAEQDAAAGDPGESVRVTAAYLLGWRRAHAPGGGEAAPPRR